MEKAKKTEVLTSHRQQKKLENLRMKIGLEVAYYMIQSNIINTIEEFHDRFAGPLEMILDGHLFTRDIDWMKERKKAQGIMSWSTVDETLETHENLETLDTEDNPIVDDQRQA